MFYSTTKFFTPGLLLTLILFVTTAMAQKPEIVAVDKANGSMGEVVTIKGSSFGIDDTDLAVFFGAARAPIQSVTNQLLEVTIPPGATLDNISVANISNGLTGYSRHQFLLSYGGAHPFDASNLGPQLNFNAGSELYDHCLCDFNNDGRVDAATANKNSTSISILQNTSTGAGNINFVTTQLPIGAVSLQIKCGDLNGDGRPDLVVTEGTTGINDRVFILQNNGGFTFTQQSINLTGRKNSKIDIADLDRNGKPEVIVTDQGSNSISILMNQSAGPIAFAPAPLVLTIPDAATTDGIGVKDFNGDDLPDIVTSQFGTANSNLYIVPNSSVPGTISFGTANKITIGGSIRDIRLADFDNDGKQDIAAAQFLTGKVSVLLNTSSLATITFGPATELSVEAGAWGLDAGDVDGDSKPDIVVATIATTNLTILNNESTPGNLAFTRHTAATQFITRHVRIGDLDGDGKPDISFSSVDKSGVPASKVSVFRNESCVMPTLRPTASPIALCGGALPYTLTATFSRGSFYQWLKDGVPVACGLNQNTFNVTAGTGTGTYTVKIIGEGGTCATAGACAVESAGIDIVIGGATAVTVNPTNNGPVCIGSPLNLSVSNDLGSSYRWTGPAGFTSNIKSPSIADFQLAIAGRYTVEVTVGTCIASIETTIVEAIDAPVFQVDAGVSNVMCQGDPVKILSVANAPGFTYQWLKNGTPIGGAVTNTFTVTSVPASSGAYAVTASYPGCATVTTPPVDIRVAALPVAAFTAPPPACAGQKVTFTNQSTGDPSLDLFYAWDFEDGPTSNAENPEHIFASPGTYDVLLIVMYKDGMCSRTATHPITITAAPAVAITNPDNDYLICAGESITLEVIGTFTSYAWSTGATGSSITATDDGTYTVDVTAVNGCVLTATRDVTGLPAPGVVVTATPQQINEGESTQLSAAGLENFQWTPEESLTTAPNIADPVANPLVTTTYTVTGTDANGCTGTATIQVTVLGEAIVNKLAPKNFFSPNNDGPNELWQVDNIADYPQCGVTIYDDKGVKVYSAKPYNNDWNGTFNGKALPNGVYFFVIRCDGEENAPRTGSITVIR